jgi:hypothetical protein
MSSARVDGNAPGTVFNSSREPDNSARLQSVARAAAPSRTASTRV